MLAISARVTFNMSTRQTLKESAIYSKKTSSQIIEIFSRQGIFEKLLFPRPVTYFMEYAFTFTFASRIPADLRMPHCL